MRLSKAEFKAWPKKTVTLLGMSGVGKTRVARILRKAHWFHYSVDYRIGTRYLNEVMLDSIKYECMKLPLLRQLLLSDAVHINHNISIDNLDMVSSFLGQLGDPNRDGIDLKEFKRRQKLHHAAEIAATKDLPDFIQRAHHIYHYNHVINDVSGSLCELEDPSVFDILHKHTVMLYVRTTKKDEQELIRRAHADPKPLYYRAKFLEENLAIYLTEQGLEYAALIDPAHFSCWLFPRLFKSRIPHYEKIAEQYAYTVSAADLNAIQTEEDFLKLVEHALSQ